MKPRLCPHRHGRRSSPGEGRRWRGPVIRVLNARTKEDVDDGAKPRHATGPTPRFLVRSEATRNLHRSAQRDGLLPRLSPGEGRGPMTVQQLATSCAHSRRRRSRSALAITETELNDMASAAIIGLSRMPTDGIQHARGNRNADQIVDEGEEQVLPDVAHGGAAEHDRPDDAGEIAFHQRDAGARDRHLGAGAHGDADIGRGQRGGVIHAVAGHGDDAAFGLQATDQGVLVGRQHLGNDLPQSPGGARRPRPWTGCRRSA